MSKCCDGQVVFGEDNHSTDCKNWKDEPDDTEEGYDPEPNAEANRLWEAR